MGQRKRRVPKRMTAEPGNRPSQSAFQAHQWFSGFARTPTLPAKCRRYVKFGIESDYGLK